MIWKKRKLIIGIFSVSPLMTGVILFAMEWEGPRSSWDIYGYSYFDGVESLYEEFLSKGAFIVYRPQIEDLGNKRWNEFAIKDIDGYVIVFGGSNCRPNIIID